MPVVGIFGPTASGKTDVAEALAARVDSDLISADAMQVYRGLPILTNQSERPTALVAIKELDEEMSVGEYQGLAHRAIDHSIGRGRLPIVVGGTGLYLRAALGGLVLPPAPEPGARERFDGIYERVGPEAAHELLAGRDPDAAARIHPNDRRRVVRAMELADVGESLAPREDTLWGEGYRHPTVVFGLDVPRDVLDERIRRRTERMLARGVEEEVRSALAGPISRTASAIHGLRDFADLPRDDAAAVYDARVRRYASYQRKWLRRIPGVVIIDADRPPTEVADELLQLARARQRLPGDGAVRADA
jgi:tRNA dimethylallyltransferase